MIGLGANNIIAGTTGYNLIQSGLEYVSGGTLGVKTYAAIDLAASGGALMTKMPTVVNSVVFGRRVAYQPLYRNMSSAGLSFETFVHINTIHGAIE